jgi:hypothetical protein
MNSAKERVTVGEIDVTASRTFNADRNREEWGWKRAEGGSSPELR